jgi:hypothetical protein
LEQIDDASQAENQALHGNTDHNTCVVDKGIDAVVSLCIV